MKTRTILAAAAIALSGAFAFSGCTGAPGASKSAESSPAKPGSDAASAFLDCLKSAEVEAKINESGQVMVKLPPQPESGEGDAGMLEIDGEGDGVVALEGDEAGDAWAAVTSAEYFADDPATQDAYAACEKEHPEFTQPTPDPKSDPSTRDQMKDQLAAGIAFAKCARENGHTGIADPDPATGGAVMLPEEMTEDEFRALAKVCYDPKSSVPFGVRADASFDPWKSLEELNGEPAS
jgi:hypothetical protein